jgi:hypothetical protein
VPTGAGAGAADRPQETLYEVCECFLTHYIIFINKFIKRSLSIAKEQKLDIFENNSHKTLTGKSFR